MSVSRKVSKSCCGGSASIMVYTDKPIKKHQVKIFIDAGFTAPETFVNNGIFYVRKDSLIATSSFGTTRVNVKCGSHKKEEKLLEFERLLEIAVNTLE